MFNVASYIVWGDQGSPIEPEAAELAVKYYKKNAENGDTDSMLDLGAMYLMGRGVPQDEEKAFDLYVRTLEICEEVENEKYLVNDSYSDVCSRLAECYHYGIGTEIDLEQAKEYIQIAKEETKKRLDDGDMYGGYLYPRALKEWQAIMAEADNRNGV